MTEEISVTRRVNGDKEVKCKRNAGTGYDNVDSQYDIRMEVMRSIV